MGGYFHVRNGAFAICRCSFIKKAGLDARPFLILIVVAIPAVISTRNFWIAIPVLFVCILAAFTNKVAAKFGRQ